MKMVVAGGTGQVGAVIARAFRDENEIVVLSRHPSANNLYRCVHWDGKSLGPWTDELNAADVVINLAGRSVNCRYQPRNRREILKSRVDSVRAIGRVIQEAKAPPRVWLQAATATIYAHRFDAPNDEFTGVIGGDEVDAPSTWRFSTDVAKAWEAAVSEVGPLPKTRTVVMRSSMIMSPDRGGIFATLLMLVRLGLGGKASHGRQFISWIHENDFVRAVRYLIDNESFAGPVNVCSPGPLPNAEFMRDLRRAWGIPIGMPATRWMLEIGAYFLRTETELILKSRRVIPGRLLQSGFEFQFPHWPDAARDLCQCYRDIANKTAAHDCA
jgi:uncharacterized protein (TIGR01777 family)